LKAYGVLQVVPDLAFLTALVLARFLNAGAAGAVAGQIIGWVTLAAGAVLFGYRHWSRGTVDARITRKLVGYGVRSWPLVMLQFGIARIAIIVGARYVAPEELGYYVLASGIADALSLVPGLAANLVFNAVSARRAGARELAFAVMRAASTGMWLVVVPAALVGRPLFDVLFSASFAPAWTLLVILFGTSLTRGIVPIHLAMLAGQGRPELANLVQLTEFGILLLVMPLAASRFGAVGMAVAAVTASASSYLVSLTIVRRFERARILDLVGIKRHDLLHIRQRLAGMIAARRIRTDGIG
jgi:O-antigen/teichoic acid export membrane protein